MIYRSLGDAPLAYARVAAILFLIMVVAAEFSTGVVGVDVVVPGDAAATAGNILANESRFRAGILGHLVVLFTDVGIAVLLYLLLRPVSRSVALLAAVFRLTMVAIRGVLLLTHFLALRLLSGEEFLNVFDTEQLQALTLLSLNLFEDGVLLDFVFFGVHIALVGYLVYKSGFLPRLLGAWLMLSGVGYLVNSLTGLGYVLSGYEPIVTLYIFLPSAVSEFALFLWLLVKGVDVESWENRAAESSYP